MKTTEDRSQARSTMFTGRSSLLKGVLIISTITLLIHNRHSSTQQHPSPTSTHRHLTTTSPSAAVATLVTNDSTDISELCLAVKSLLFLKGGYGGSFVRGGPAGLYTNSPVLVFNEGNLSRDQMTYIESCTSRPVAFPVTNLNHFPTGFDPDDEWKTFERWTDFRPASIQRSNWSYSQMVRFWTTLIWNHPAIQQFETIMKLDSDACFLRQRFQNMNPLYQEAPGLDDQYVYQTNYDGLVGGDLNFIDGLYQFAVEYMQEEGLSPANPRLWDIVRTTWEDTGNLPVFQTTFEIGRKTFFQREDVVKWHEALTEREPFGVFRWRWGDAQTRVLTMAMFAKEDQVLLSKSVGYLHGKGRCAKNFLEEIHERFKTEDRW